MVETLGWIIVRGPAEIPQALASFGNRLTDAYDTCGVRIFNAPNDAVKAISLACLDPRQRATVKDFVVKRAVVKMEVLPL